jgi:hypothetical protein
VRGGPVRRRTVRGGCVGGRHGCLAQQAVDDVPERREARLDESEGLVARRGDARVDVGLVLDEVRLQVGFVDVGRTLRGDEALVSVLLKFGACRKIEGHVPRIEGGRGKVGGAF